MTAGDRLDVLVAGATGTQGGAVARLLLARGHRVRAFVRDPESPRARELARLGSAIVPGAFADTAALDLALEGADAAFLVATPFEAGTDAEVADGIAQLEAAARAGTPHVVYSSVAGALDDTGIPHFETKAVLEARLAGLGLPATVVAPAFFMENVLAPWMLPALRQGSLPFALDAERPLQQLAVADLAAFVVRVLEQRDAYVGRRVEIASDAIAPAEQARALSAATGREIAHVRLTPDDLRAYGDEDSARMFEWFARAGFAVDLDALRREAPEIGWHDYRSWAAAQDWSVLAQEAAA